MPPLRGGKSLVTISTFGIGLLATRRQAAGLTTIKPRGCGPSDLNDQAANVARRPGRTDPPEPGPGGRIQARQPASTPGSGPDGSVEFRLVPAAERDLLDVRAGLRRVDQVIAAHVDAYMRVACEAEDVARLQITEGHRRKRAHLVVTDARDRNAC